MDKKADGLSKDFFRDFHGVMNPDLVTNIEIIVLVKSSKSSKIRFNNHSEWYRYRLRTLKFSDRNLTFKLLRGQNSVGWNKLIIHNE